MNMKPVSQKSPWEFFILVFLLTIPFIVLGALNGIEILRGIPFAGLAIFCPAIAAMILVYKEAKWSGVWALLKRVFDFRRIKVKAWYIPTLLLYPAVVILSFFILRLSGDYVPSPQIEIIPTLLLSIGFFIGGALEELGWSGYATEPLQRRWGALKASLIIGAVWAIWHWIPLLQVHRSVDWIVWWTFYTLAARVIIVWLFNNMGKSVFAATLFHMMLNLAWQSFPVHGSYFNQPVISVLMVLIAIVVMLVWEPKTLAKYRLSRRS